MTRPARRELFGWVLATTRPVLAPLAASTLCRIADQLLGVAIFAFGAGAVVAAGRAVAGGNGSAIATGTLVVLLVAACLLKAALRYGEQFLGHLVAFKALELLRAEVFHALVPRAPRVLLGARSGELMTRATKDVDRIEIFFAHTLAPMVSAVVVPVVVLVTIGVSASGPVALAASPFLLAALTVVPVLGHRSSLAAARRAAGTRARLAHHVTDSLQGMREVVGYGRSGERLAQTDALGSALTRDSRPPTWWSALRRCADQMLLLAAAIAMVCVGLAESRAGRVSAVALAASIAAVIRLTEVVRSVEELATAVSASMAAMERVWETVHSPLLVPDGQADLAPARAREVAWQQVTYSYPGSHRPALEQVDVRAAAGQWTCLVGASGSGKSTLVDLALRFDDPAAGRVLVDGRDLRELRAGALRREIALVTQQPYLLRATVAENVRLAAPEASDQEMVAACRAAGIHDDIMAWPQRYETLVGERGTSLSGGQGQRLALARMLLARPSVLVLDEFTAQLDPGLAARVRAAVRAYLPAATIVEVSHRIGALPGVDQVVVLDAGRVVQAGVPAELLAIDGPLRRLAAREPEICS